MIGGRRQMLLVLALIVGVLGMHALVVMPTAPAADLMTPSVAVASAAAHEGFTHVSASTPDATAIAPVMLPAADHFGYGGGHGSMPSSLHHVLHLCLAILATLMVLGMSALACWPTRRPDPQAISIGQLVRRAPRCRPPPTSVRLAQLCVLRT